MAKDILGREITDPALVRMQNTMNKEPVATTVGRGTRSAVTAAGQAAQGLGALVNQAPKLVGIPAAGVANAVSSGIANFQTGFTGQKYNPQEFQALTMGQMLDRTMVPGRAAASPLAVPSVVPTTPKPAASTYVPGAGLPSRQQVASDKSRAMFAQAANDERLGVSAPAGPAAISVSRQANGNLSFTGSGGDGTGAVRYTGMPSWTSQRGGAGQGSVGSGWDLASQNARMAAFVQNAQAEERQKATDRMIADMASGAGGAVGVAQNKLAMQALGPLVERQMANENALKTTGMTTAAQLRGQDKDSQDNAARVAASRYGTDVGAKTAADQMEVDREKVKALALSARAKQQAGKPISQIEQLGLRIFEGKGMTEAARKAAKADYTEMFKGANPLEGMIAEMMARQQMEDQ